MATPLQSLVASGTKLWLDSVDPELVEKNIALGATGATSNPAIIADLVKTGRYDTLVGELIHEGFDDEDIAWGLTDHLVETAQQEFFSVWERTGGNDGYVSFELDPLIEDPQRDMPHDERVAKYVELGEEWAAGQPNRMIKVPGTDAGIAALEQLAAAGVTLNVTLLFTLDQYERARDAVWRGAQRRNDLENFKSVYSIFVSRIDVYTEKHCPNLHPTAAGHVGVFNAKRVWQSNQKFWSDKKLALQQEIIFASTGVKNPDDKPWKYVEALAGSDIQTNPPSTNDAVQQSGLTFTRRVDEMPSPAVQVEIETAVDFNQLHDTLMREGVQKFSDPQNELLKAIASKRTELATA